MDQGLIRGGHQLQYYTNRNALLQLSLFVYDSAVQHQKGQFNLHKVLVLYKLFPDLSVKRFGFLFMAV